MTRRTAAGVACAGLFAAAAAPQDVSSTSSKGDARVLQVFQELFDVSTKEKKGLTFYIGGQTVPGLVVKMHGDEVVEVMNRTAPRILIRIDRIDAVQLG
ncbi:MAG: hypothetical protein KIT09_00750 [Bryobacteraceae bacterium]|nr:hypothetical protein [Bryobacteraceae bacterium]